MRKKINIKNKWLWLGGGVVLLLLGIMVATTVFLTPWLRQKLVTTVKEQSKGMYTLRLHGFEASILRSRLAADSLELVPDYALWEKRSQEEKQALPRMLIELKAGPLLLAGINYIEMLRGKPLHLHSLKLEQPDLLLTQMRLDITTTHEPLYVSLQGIARNLMIEEIDVAKARLRFKQTRNAEAPALSLENVRLQVDDFRLDSASLHKKGRAYYARRISFASGKARYLLPNRMYRLQFSALKANTADRTLHLDSLRLVPLLSQAAMSREEARAVTLVKLDVPEVNLSGVNYYAHSRYSNLEAKEIQFKQPRLSAFLDRKNFALKGEKPLPHDLLQQVKTGFTLDTVLVEGMYVRYDELAPDASETGHITFQNLNATITNISNDKSRMSAENPAQVQLKTAMMGKANLEITIRLALLNPNGYHTIKGAIGPTDPQILNPILEPTNFVSIKSGQINHGMFDITLHRNTANGTMRLAYQNFKVAILSKQPDKRQTLGGKILSKVANAVAIKSDNTAREGEALRVGEISVTRNKNRSVFNYWKDCLLSGLLSSIGLEAVAEK